MPPAANHNFGEAPSHNLGRGSFMGSRPIRAIHSAMKSANSAGRCRIPHESARNRELNSWAGAPAAENPRWLSEGLAWIAPTQWLLRWLGQIQTSSPEAHR